MIANVKTTVTTAVGGASTIASAALKPNVPYLITATVGCWIAQGSAPTAVAGVGSSMFVPGSYPIEIDGSDGASLAVIQAAGPGFISITSGAVE